MIIHKLYGPQFDGRDGTIGGLKLIKRFVLLNAEGEFVHAMQGRYTYEKEGEAQKVADKMKEANPSVEWCQSLFVAPYWCYPRHFDPCGSVEGEG